MISVFTPSHDVRFLERAYKSLLQQTNPNWEWVLLLNGKALSESLSFLEDDRVKINKTSVVNNVGKLKEIACELATGDLLLELDHDDELHPTCLQEVLDTAVKTPGGFYFSDFCEMREDGSSNVYGTKYGWESYSAKWGDRDILAMKSKEATARSIYQIFYAPNHVRVWSREAYDKAGGYNGSYPVCDDHDLLVRTYLAGVPMIRIPKCLYLQNCSASQTQVRRNQEIQVLQGRIGAKNLNALCLEWARREGLPCYDLGGAHNGAPGYLTIDKHPGASIQHDVLAGLPFADSSVGVLRAFDFLEHIPLGSVVPFMNECYRVLAPGGWLLTATPSTDGRGAFQDPTHVSFWNDNSFWYYTQRQHMQYVPEVTCRFQLARLHRYFPSDFCAKNNIPYVAADLWALKGQDRCGEDLT